MNATATLHKQDVLLLERLSHGLSDEMIGQEMHLSAEAVRANVRGVVSTLGARNREHAVAIALKTGLIR
jgi:DNA-binding NarL/FixJ family response regulator